MLQRTYQPGAMNREPVGFPRKEEITFFLTMSCNLGCRYCYMPKVERRLGESLLDLEFARVGLIDFFRTSKSRTIRFFAPGEPSLAYPRMVEIWEIAKAMAGDDLRTEIETNGYFGEPVSEWIERHVDYLWISCDGWDVVQDEQRPPRDGGSSSPVVLSNIKRFADNSRLQTGVRSTIEPQNLGRQVELVEFFRGLGVKHLAASPVYHSKANPDITTASLLEFAKGFVPAFYRAKELGMDYLTLLMVNFDEEVDIYCQTSLPTPRLTIDGYVSCCDWAAFGSPDICFGSQQDLIYGWYDRQRHVIVYDDAKIERIRRRNVAFLGQHHCRSCPALRHCAGGCVGKMMAETDDLYTPTDSWCEAVRYLFERLPVNKGLHRVLHP